MSPTLHLGINTCFAIKRWPEPARWVRIVVDELGLRDAQVSLDLFAPGLEADDTSAYAAAVVREAAAAGLRLHSTFTGISAYAGNLLLHPDPQARRASESWFVRAIELTSRLGARGTGGFLGAMSMADACDAQRREALLAELGSSMARLAERASRHSLEFLLFENMAVAREYGHVIQEAQALEVIGQDGGAGRGAVPWVLCLDLGHPCALRTGTASDDPLRWIETAWARVPVFQIQQANRDGDHHWPFTRERNRVGLLRAEAVARALARMPTDDDVYLFFEVIHAPEHPDGAVLAELRESVEHWRQALAGAWDGRAP